MKRTVNRKREVMEPIFLTKEEHEELAEALDSHIYWSLSEEKYRDSGFVYGKGSDDEDDRERIKKCKKLAERLSGIAKQMERREKQREREVQVRQ